MGETTMQELATALETVNLKILKYDQTKQRPVTTNRGTMNVEKFCTMAMKELSRHAAKFPAVWESLHDCQAAEKLLQDYAKKQGILKTMRKVEIEMPPGMDKLVLNLNLAAKGREDRFFLTHPDETISKISGDAYLLLNQMSPLEAAAEARKVIPEYHPRGPRGAYEVKSHGKVDVVFNTYTPPLWASYPRKTEDKLPPLFDKLVRHLFPLGLEREYFFAWLHDSLFKRAFTFLILCGAPGTGKNRLKLVLRALHGHVNTIDGKKSTLVERFNSQLSEATLAWFDELYYDAEMENTMKELQNDSISIERKGVDATKATPIHASIVISNNKPRDNYIAFDARKFVPLVVTPRRLEMSMTASEIDDITKKVENPTSPDFDVALIAQIARWVKRHGASRKWPHLEYKGPMFWTLAHTSMTRWQKKAVTLLLGEDIKNEKHGWNPDKKAFLWSSVQARCQKKNGDRSLQFPDYTSTRAFFEVFRDASGKKAFHTENVSGINLLGDFWVRPLLKDLQVVTESAVIQQREMGNAGTGKKEVKKGDKEYLDL